MSDAITRRAEAAAALNTVTAAHTAAVQAEDAARTTLVELRTKRETQGVNPIDASAMLAVLDELPRAEAAHASAEKQRAAIADLVASLTTAYERACQAERVETQRAAIPAAEHAVAEAARGLKAWTDQLNAAIDAAERAALPTSGSGWSRAFEDVLRSARVTASFTRRK